MIGSVIAMYRQSFAGLPREVWWLALVLLVNRAGSMVMPFMVLYLTEVHGYAPGEAGLALAFYGIGAVIGTAAGGWLTDRIGPKRVMMTSLVTTGMAFIVLGWMETPTGILGTLVVLSILNESFRPANGAAVAACCPRELQKQAFALVRLAVNAGMSIGPVVGGFLADRDFSYLFIVDGVTCLVAALCLIKLSLGCAAPSGPEAATARRDASPWRDREFLIFAALMTISAAMFFQLFGAYVLHFSDVYGFNNARIGGLLAINTGVIVLFEMVLVHKLRHRSEMHLVGFGAALVGVGFALLPFGSGEAWAAFSVIIWTIGEMLVGPIGAGCVAHRAPPAGRGRYMAVFTMGWAIGNMLGPWLGTVIYQVMGPDVLWISCGLIGLLLWPSFAALAKRWRATG